MATYKNVTAKILGAQAMQAMHTLAPLRVFAITSTIRRQDSCAPVTTGLDHYVATSLSYALKLWRQETSGLQAIGYIAEVGRVTMKPFRKG